MRAFTRFATFALLAVHLAAVSAPCPTAKLPDHQPESGSLSGIPAQPCPGHSDAHGGSAWFDDRCPCGCETGAPPGGATSRTGPALLLAPLAPVCAPDRDPMTAAPSRLVRIALAPPDHVPLPIA